MSREYREQTAQGSLPRKRAIKARVFVAAFREYPDDFYLLLRFSITPAAAQENLLCLIGKGTTLGKRRTIAARGNYRNSMRTSGHLQRRTRWQI